MPAAARAQFFEIGTPSVSVAYTLARTNSNPGQCGCFYLNGGTGEFALPLRPRFSVVADLSGGTASAVNGGSNGLSLFTYTVGPRLSLPVRRVQPFLETFVGGAYGFHSYFPTVPESNSAGGLALLAGGGIEIPVRTNISLRPIQADYLLTRLANGSNNRQNSIRLSFGAVLRFR
jgi:hypothetical protein